MHDGPLERRTPATWSEGRLFLVVAGLVLASRLPFLGPGYGTLSDAWRVAWAAEVFATTGRYEASRFPGYPVQEIGSALLSWGGPLALTGATALLCAVAAGCFALIVRRLGSGDGLLAGLALASVPTLYIVSTQARDDAWALAFGLVGLWLVLRGRVVAAGVAAGLAIGSRITYGAWLVPLGIALWIVTPPGHRWRAVGSMVAIGLAVGALAFLPSFLTYGTGFLRYYSGGPLPAVWIVKHATVDLWGIPGTIAIVLAVASLLLPRGTRPRRAIPQRSDVHLWAGAGIGLFAVAFLRLPHHSVYLIPTVPFVLLLLGRLVDRRAFVAVCVACIVSPWVLKVSEAGGRDAARFADRDPSVAVPGVPYRVGLMGPLLTDHLRRVAHTRFVDRTLVRVRGLEDSSVVVAHEFLPEIRVRLHGKVDGHVRFEYLLTEDEFVALERRGVALYALPGAAEKTRDLYGFDPLRRGVRPLYEAGDPPW